MEHLTLGRENGAGTDKKPFGNNRGKEALVNYSVQNRDQLIGLQRSRLPDFSLVVNLGESQGMNCYCAAQ